MRIRHLVLLTALLGCGGGGSKPTGDDTTRGPGGEGPLQYSPIVQYDEYLFEGIRVRQYIPPDPIGVMFFFHGTNLSVDVINKIEVIALVNELVVEGIGYVVTESEDRVNGKWYQDPDVPRVGRLYEHVIETTEIEPDDALFAAGFSGGGNMTGMFDAYAVDQGWPMTAAHPSHSACSPCDLSVPTIHVLAENDTSPHAPAYSLHDNLEDAGTPHQILMIDEKILAPDSFTKHPSMTPETSEDVFEDLIAKDFIDAQGNRLIADPDMEDACDWYENNGGVPSPSTRAGELRVLWAMHRYSGEYSREVRDFFLDQI